MIESSDGLLIAGIILLSACFIRLHFIQYKINKMHRRDCGLDERLASATIKCFKLEEEVHKLLLRLNDIDGKRRR